MANTVTAVADRVVRGLQNGDTDPKNRVTVADNDGRSHKFYVRSLKLKARLEAGETSYFRHEHPGQDDRVFYTINLGKKKGQYRAKISRIEYRGFLNKNGTKRFGIEVTDALNAAGPKGAVASRVIKFLQGLNLQSRLEGPWEVAAAKVVDAIGKRMARDIK